MERFKALWERFQKAAVSSDNFQGDYRGECAFIQDRFQPIFSASELSYLATVGNLEQKAEKLTMTLLKAQPSQCSDNRDRIYGLLGIMTAMFGPDFMEANYEYDVVDVYTDFASRLITKTGSLAILNATEYICNSTSGLPTWVPDWSSCFYRIHALQRSYYNVYFSASGPVPADPHRIAPAYHLSPSWSRAEGSLLKSR